MLWSTIVQTGYKAEKMTLGQITILGVETQPTSVTLNGKTIQGYTYKNKVSMLELSLNAVLFTISHMQTHLSTFSFHHYVFISVQ